MRIKWIWKTSTITSWIFQACGSSRMGNCIDINSEPKIAPPQIREFYYNMDKINSGYITTIVDDQEFHLWSSHIAKILEVPHEGDCSCFNNVRTRIFMENYILEDELVGSVSSQGSSFNNPAKAKVLTKMAFIF